MSVIHLENIEFFAYHGHFKEEKIVGNKFIINLEMVTDTTKAELSDDLKDTLDYQQTYKKIKEVMATPVNLLEHLAHKILDKLFSSFNELEYAKIKISKMNPPIGGQMQCVSFTLDKSRQK